HPFQQQAVGAPAPVVALRGPGDVALELDVGRGVDRVVGLAADVHLFDRGDQGLAGRRVPFVRLAVAVERLADLAGGAFRRRVAGAGVGRPPAFAEEFVVFDEADQFEEVALRRARREFRPAAAEHLPTLDHPAPFRADRDRRDPVVVVGAAEQAGVGALAAAGAVAIDAGFAFEQRPLAPSRAAAFGTELADRFA